MSRKPTILIAEDQAGPRMALRFLLQDDYQLLFAENGIEAVERVRNEVPDLILTDIRMPRMKGWEAIREIRDSGYSVPIIVMTGLP